jgi:hypothetical protein
MGSGVVPLFQIYNVKVQKVACVIKHPCSPSSGICHQALARIISVASILTWTLPDHLVCMPGLHAWEVLPVMSPGQIMLSFGQLV